MKRKNEKKYEFRCSKCGELKEKTVSQKLIKKIKKRFGFDIEKIGIMFLSITCDKCNEVVVKEKKCKLCEAPLKNYLDVFCSSKCHKAYLKKKIKIDYSKGPCEIEFTGTMPSEMVGRIPVPKEDYLPEFTQIDDVKDDNIKDRELGVE